MMMVAAAAARVAWALAALSVVRSEETLTRYFYFGAERINWEEASNECKYIQDGGTLATIDNAEVNSRVLEFLQDHATDWPESNGYGGAWLGASDISEAGEPTWERPNRNNGYVNWGNNEPNNAGNEDCVAMWVDTSGKIPGTWNDDTCSAILRRFKIFTSSVRVAHAR